MKIRTYIACAVSMATAYAPLAAQVGESTGVTIAAVDYVVQQFEITTVGIDPRFAAPPPVLDREGQPIFDPHTGRASRGKGWQGRRSDRDLRRLEDSLGARIIEREATHVCVCSQGVQAHIAVSEPISADGRAEVAVYMRQAVVDPAPGAEDTVSRTLYLIIEHAGGRWKVTNAYLARIS